MDRNTVIGLIIIGVILSVFTIFNQPSEADLKKQKEQISLNEKKQKENEEKAKSAEQKEKAEIAKPIGSLVPKLEKDGTAVVTAEGVVYTDTITGRDTTIVKSAAHQSKPIVKGELIMLENEKLRVFFSTKGGKIASVRL